MTLWTHAPALKKTNMEQIESEFNKNQMIQRHSASITSAPLLAPYSQCIFVVENIFPYSTCDGKQTHVFGSE